MLNALKIWIGPTKMTIWATYDLNVECVYCIHSLKVTKSANPAMNRPPKVWFFSHPTTGTVGAGCLWVWIIVFLCHVSSQKCENIALEERQCNVTLVIGLQYSLSLT